MINRFYYVIIQFRQNLNFSALIKMCIHLCSIIFIIPTIVKNVKILGVYE